MNKKLFLTLLNSGVEIPHYFLLYLIHNNDIDNTVIYQLKVKSWLLAMEKKGLIVTVKDEIKLTSKGLKILTQINASLDTITSNIELPNNHLKNIAISITNKVNEKIFKATKSRRLSYKVDGKSYHINVSYIEMENSLINFIKLYDFADFVAIEAAIIAYIDDILEGKITYPKKLNNFIIKIDKQTKEFESDLMMYIETVTTQEKNKIINTRDLFG